MGPIVGYRYGSSQVQVWSVPGTGMGPTAGVQVWVISGTGMKPPRYRYGAHYWVQVRHLQGTGMGPLMGTGMGHTRYRYCKDTASPLYPLMCACLYTCDLDALWVHIDV